MSEAEILFERRGTLGLVTLNRPRALNALTLDMVRALTLQLKAWAKDEHVHAVAIRGAGERALCAGGDIRALYDSGKAGTAYASAFWGEEYRLNTLIKEYPKPYVALMHGIVMGGGVGVALHGSHRVACETTTFAMPETGIGLFPDVGGTYFLSRLTGRIGLYLGLTGARLKAADLRHLGLATHVAPFAGYDAIVEALAHEGPERALRAYAEAPAGAPIEAVAGQIDAHFGGESVDQVAPADPAQAAVEAVPGASEPCRDVVGAVGAEQPFDLCGKLGGGEVEDAAAVGFPGPVSVVEHGGGGAEIGDVGIVFHAAALERLEAERQPDERS